MGSAPSIRVKATILYITSVINNTCYIFIYTPSDFENLVVNHHLVQYIELTGRCL